MRIFLGKFSTKYPEQIKKKIYAAGPEGSPLYGGLKPGDYVFPAYDGMILGLWRAKEYVQGNADLERRGQGYLQFEEIKTFEGVSVSNNFTKYKYFEHDLNLVNKVTKSVKNLGFIRIKERAGCPKPEDIDFISGSINIYIAYDNTLVRFKEGDVRVTIDKSEDMRIISIDRFEDNTFVLYTQLNKLYEERNADDSKYSIRELYDYSIQDQAVKKRKFLTTLIDELETKGYLKVSNAIKLYDNLLVGRKRLATSKIGQSSGVAKDQIIGDETVEEENEQYEEIANLINFNPNIILYGPPGTGKTYATQNIIDYYEKKSYKSNSNYAIAEAEGRIKSVTFHQSYSYEEFIEGIRPVLNDAEGSNVGYQLENGLFKEHCINAEKELIKRKDNAEYVDMIHSGSAIWKVSLGERKSDDIFNECIKNNDIAIGWLENNDLSDMGYDEILESLGDESDYGDKPTQNANTINAFVNDMTIGDIVFVFDGQQTIRMIGVITGGYRYDAKHSRYKQRREVQWFKELAYPINIHAYNGYKNLTMKTVYQLNRVSIPDVLEIITMNSKEKQSYDDKKEIKPYYMIVDEINRGNIAKIFGELITLIEQDKRGRLKVVLPYSKKEFTVPANLIIIGTMNTADRSIAAIDTALRRRFTFVEIEPDATVIARYDNPVVNDTIDLVKLLNAINEKIMSYYDRNHRVGHAYFMGIESLGNFYQIWYYKILPLLSEYFYNDVETMRAVVGKAFYDENGNILKLSRFAETDELSPFEKQIQKIYKGTDNA